LISHVELTSPIIGSPVANDEWEVINSYDSKNSSASSKLNARRRTSAQAAVNNNSPAATTLTQNQSKGHSLSSASSHSTSSPNTKQQQPVYNLNLSNNKSVNIMNLDPNSNGRSSLIALWSNNAADKAVSVFQKMFQSLSRSNSFSFQSKASSSPSVQNKHSRAETFANNETTIPQQQQPPVTIASQIVTPPPPSPPQSVPSRKATAHVEPLFNPFDINHVEQSIKLKQPLGDAEFRNFLDSDGRIVQPEELRQRIFEGGIDPGKRKELWPILLNVFPHPNMTFKQRADFLKQKVQYFYYI
jgi:hypothetical protein